MTLHPSPRRFHRLRRLAAAFFFLLMAFLAAAAAHLAGSTAGAHRLASLLRPRLPQLSFEIAGGSLWRGLDLRNVSWTSGGFSASLDSFSARWRFDFFGRPTLVVSSLAAEGLRIVLPADPDPSPALPWFDALDPARRQPVSLPAFRLPIRVAARNVSLRRIAISSAQSTRALSAVALSADGDRDQWTLRRLRIDHESGRLDAGGTFQTSGNYPLDLRLRFRSDSIFPPCPVSVSISASNSVAELSWSASLDGPVALAAFGRLHPLDPSLPFGIALAWTNISWPAGGHPSFISRSGHLGWIGSLESHTLQTSFDLSAPHLPDGVLLLHAEGNLRHISIDPATFSIPGAVLSASGNVSWTNGIAGHLAIAERDNSVAVSGAYRDGFDLAGTLSLPGLSRWLPALSGSLGGTWRLAGPAASPSLDLFLGGRNLAFSNLVSASSARLEAHLPHWGSAPGRARLEIDGLSAPSAKLAASSLRAAVDGDLSGHRAEFSLRGDAFGVYAALSGALAPNAPLAWTGALDRASAAVDGFEIALESPAILDWLPDTRQLRAAPHRWLHADASLSAQSPLLLGARGSAAYALDNLDLAEFNRFLPDALRLEGRLDARAAAEWSPDRRPAASLQAALRDSLVRILVADDVFDHDSPAPALAFDLANLEIILAQTNLAAQARLRSPDLGALKLQADFPLQPGAAPLDGSGLVEIQSLDLALAKPFVPALRSLSGKIDAAVRLSGNPRRPLLHGSLSLTNGFAEAADFPVAFDSVALAVRFLGDRSECSGGFRSGNGAATIDGSADLSGNSWQADFRLAGQRLDLAYGTLATFQATPNLRLLASPRSLEITGSVSVPRADVALQQLPDSAVRPSPDVVYVDSPTGAPAPAAPSAWSNSVDVEIALGDKVAISGHGLSGRLAGNLRIQQSGSAAPRAYGEIRIEDARYRAYGQRLDVRRGQFLFAGPLDRPNLSVEAVRDVPAFDVVAGLRVEGLPDALQTSLFSEPALPDDEILAYLLLGRPLERGESDGGSAMLANAAIALGVAKGGHPAAAIAERLGVENFQLETADGSDGTQIVLSGQVTPRLALSYGVGVFDAANTLTARYRLARRLYLEAVSGLESSLDLLYYFSF